MLLNTVNSVKSSPCSVPQLRLGDYREAMRKSAAATRVWNAAKLTYDTYCTVMEEELDARYEKVQKDFSTFYRAINAEDESTFTAKLTPSEGSLGLDVNFDEPGRVLRRLYRHPRPVSLLESIAVACSVLAARRRFSVGTSCGSSLLSLIRIGTSRRTA